MPRLEIPLDLLRGAWLDIPLAWPHLHIGGGGAADRLLVARRRVHHRSELTIAPGHRGQVSSKPRPATYGEVRQLSEHEG